MKKLFTTSLIIVCFTFCKAQYVTLPDVKFVNWLNANGYSAALNGNDLDTTNVLVLAATTVDCHNSNIYNITGIQYFKNVTTLICGYNNLTFLPALPPNLANLRCYVNPMTSITELPQSLVYFDCTGDLLTSLPSFDNFWSLDTVILRANDLLSLPDFSSTSLRYLECGANEFTSLSGLPSSLIFLDCGYTRVSDMSSISYNYNIATLICNNTQITALPDLTNFPSLKYLDCSDNRLTSLSTLPDSLTTLFCFSNQITSLPTILPNSIIDLEVDNNLLSSLPALPTSLGTLTCSDNQLGSLPELPSFLHFIDVDSNQLTTLPSLPDLLYVLQCGQNKLDTLPTLPSSLSILECNYNNLTVLPSLPSSLFDIECAFNQLTALPALSGNVTTTLNCAHNLLTGLPALPASIVNISCNNNLLTGLPDLPESLQQFLVDSNVNLRCIPFLKNFAGPSAWFSIANTGITCFSNVIQHNQSVPQIDSMPICDVLNPNGCQIAWNIKGQAVKDADGSCGTTNDGTALQNISIKLYDSASNLLQQEYVNSAGNYSFDTHLGTFIVKADTTGLPFTILCPTGASKTDTLTAIDSLDGSANFRFTCKPDYDLGVNAIASNRIFFPNNQIGISVFAGDEATYYGVPCNASGLEGTITATVSGPVTIASASSNPNTISLINGNTVTWAVADFSQVDFKHDFALTLHTDVLAQAGQQVCINTSIQASGIDNNPANDTLTQCYTVVNSHDPNDKEVSPAGAIAPGYDGYLTYTIHFQNTGTAAAQNVQIIDTISNNLDISTFQLVAFSQQSITQVFAKNRVVKFSFPNINLPDSTDDLANSVGYVQYKIKPITKLGAGNSISNTGYIYFDYNSPVITNTATSTVEVATANKNVAGDNEINVYPNPATNKLIVNGPQLMGSQIEVSDLLGRSIFTQTAFSSPTTLDISQLTSGVYFLHIRSAGVDEVRKFVKE